MELRGIAAAGGVGIGSAVCIREQSLDYSGVVYAGDKEEKRRLWRAVERFNADTRKMAERVGADAAHHEAEILTGQIAMLADPFLREQLENAIDAGNCAEAAVDQVCTLYVEQFKRIEDEQMRQRAADVRDLRTRLLSILLETHGGELGALPPESVLCVRELTASMVAGLQPNQVSAFLTEAGGVTSHAAILARAMGIPAVFGIPELMTRVKSGDELIVDGAEGRAFLNPAEQVKAEYRMRRGRELARRAELAAYRARPTQMADGARVRLYANVGSVAEARLAAENGAEGVGLFRTEFLYMERSSAPTEEELLAAYQAASDCMAGKEVVIRTLDVGGDKAVGYLGMEREENPFLGHRAIRYCLDEPERYKPQLRALLRAGAKHRNLRMMLPLVTGLEELRAARALLEQCKRELAAEGTAFDGDISLGVMVETPAAAETADLLARESGFFSLGTNDLVQYTMAVDRGNPRVAQLYTPFHPAVLRAVRKVITAAKTAGIPCGMCGEAAADPRLTPLLLAWGLDEFSVNPAELLSTRARIGRWKRAEAAVVAERAMAFATAAEVEVYLTAEQK